MLFVERVMGGEKTCTIILILLQLWEHECENHKVTSLMTINGQQQGLLCVSHLAVCMKPALMELGELVEPQHVL